MDNGTGLQLLGVLFDGLEYILPPLVAILSVYGYAAIKRYYRWFDRRAAWLQQLFVVATAGIITHVTATLNIVLPTDLALFSDPEISTLLSAAMAYGIYEGRKRTGNLE